MNLLERITTPARDAGLEFVLAGGHAVIAHGYARATFDLDLIIPGPTLAQWLDLVTRLGYKVLREGGTFAQFNPPDAHSSPLDLMLVDDQTFSKLSQDSILSAFGHLQVRVVSLHHLLALKCHAIKHGHRGRIVKDADDVIELVQANRVNLASPEIRELFLKHGTGELYEKVKRACGDH